MNRKHYYPAEPKEYYEFSCKFCDNLIVLSMAHVQENINKSIKAVTDIFQYNYIYVCSRCTCKTSLNDVLKVKWDLDGMVYHDYEEYYEASL